MEEKIYTCECGKTFTKPNIFNGHKSHCMVHMQACNKLDKFIKDDENRHKSAKETISKNKYYFDLKKNDEQNIKLNLWISEKHICEKCGKIMTEKFSSGRFCSRSCANSHIQSVESNNKRRLKLSKLNKVNTKLKIRVRYCIKCGKVLNEGRVCRYCAECRKQVVSENIKRAIKNNGGNLNKKGVRGTAKYGTYKNLECDSSWELAFVVYCIDNGINIKRNTSGFPYSYQGGEHLYYPDFVVDDTLIEIKNYESELVKIKAQGVPANIKYKILYYKEMKPYIDYVKNKYGDNFYDILYDEDKPSFKDRKT